MSLEFFTFILDYKGGTYLAQVKGSLQDACREWAMNLNVPGIDFSDEAKAALIDTIENEAPTSVNGLENVWCQSSLIDDNLALIHIIETMRKPHSAI